MTETPGRNPKAAAGRYTGMAMDLDAAVCYSPCRFRTYEGSRMDTYRPVPGTPIEDLDTPCLLVDLDAVEHNFRQVAETYRDSEVKMRQHTKNTKSPLLAKMQIEAGRDGRRRVHRQALGGRGDVRGWRHGRAHPEPGDPQGQDRQDVRPRQTGHDQVLRRQPRQRADHLRHRRRLRGDDWPPHRGRYPDGPRRRQERRAGRLHCQAG